MKWSCRDDDKDGKMNTSTHVLQTIRICSAHSVEVVEVVEKSVWSCAESLFLIIELFVAPAGLQRS